MMNDVLLAGKILHDIIFYVLVGCLGDVAKFALQSAREEDHVIRETVSHADVLEKMLLLLLLIEDRNKRLGVWSVNSLSN